jgi:SAM-dependent methyltransferase
MLEHLSIYMDAHWGDKADPAAGYACESLVAKIAERASHRVALAVELGCSAGRILAELARGADHVVGVELQHGALRRAQRLLAGGPVAYARRMIGRHYTPAVARAGDLVVPAERRTLVCGDALDPPLNPGAYQRVVALNLLDVVRRPIDLFAVLDGLCARGGEVIVSSPYAWQSSHVDEDARLGGADPAAAIRALFAGGLSRPYTIEDDAELAWTLRRDARGAATYCIHYIRARKG